MKRLVVELRVQHVEKDWFIDSGPARAKAKGRDHGLPRSLADLFPARLVHSELGEIPEGWPIETLADHFEAVKGVSYKGSGLGAGGVPLHNLNSIHEGGGYKYEGIKYYSGEHAERHVVLPGDVIVANTEQGHQRLLIGYAAVVPRVYGNYGIASHHIYRVRSKPVSRLKESYLCFLLNSPKMHDLVSGFANGTTVNMLPVDALQKPPIVCPPGPLVEEFGALVVNARQRCEELLLESRTLASLCEGEKNVWSSRMTDTLLTVPDQKEGRGTVSRICQGSGYSRWLFDLGAAAGPGQRGPSDSGRWPAPTGS